MQTRRWREYNWPLLVCVLVLLVIGALAVYSATLTAVTFNGAPLSTLFPRQLVYIAIGLVLMTMATLLDYRLLSSLARPIYLGAVVTLAVVHIIGQVSGGAQSWIAVGERTIQPGEVAKLALVLALAAYWQHFEPRRDHWLVQMGALLITLVPLLLVLIQPDLGTALVMLGIWLVMAWGSGVRPGQLVALALLALPLLYVAWTTDLLLDDYQRRRLLTFYYLLRDPAQVNRDDAYNVVQALNAIGQGGWFGTGLTRGIFSQGNYVPVQHTDFIFAVIGEEMGFLGAVVLITFQALLLWQALTIAGQARDLFGRLIALGVFGMLFWHVLINIGMNLSLLPVTGLPLPLISHGGSFTLTVLIGIGLLQSITLRRRRIAF
ncbi:MAG: rod shape-determining protein RodA [Chloroflexi bacterium]|nr:rod shape-determining protein RodA [Chloroflexota bacterium]